MLLIFDLDNTLIDRDTAFEKCLLSLFSQQNCSLSAEDLLMIKQHDNSGQNDRDFFCRFLAQYFPNLKLNADAIFQRFRTIPDFIAPDPNIIQQLKALKGKHTLALLSNGSSHMQRRKLANAQLTDLFDSISISGEIGVSKPDPKIFHHVLAEHCTPLSNVVMIGDDYNKDIIPAQKLNIKSIWISHSGPYTMTPSYSIIKSVTDIEGAIQACST